MGTAFWWVPNTKPVVPSMTCACLSCPITITHCHCTMTPDSIPEQVYSSLSKPTIYGHALAHNLLPLPPTLSHPLLEQPFAVTDIPVPRHTHVTPSTHNYKHADARPCPCTRTHICVGSTCVEKLLARLRARAVRHRDRHETSCATSYKSQLQHNPSHLLPPPPNPQPPS